MGSESRIVPDLSLSLEDYRIPSSVPQTVSVLCLDVALSPPTVLITEGTLPAWKLRASSLREIS